MNHKSTSHDFASRFDQGTSGQGHASLLALLITLIVHVILFLVLPEAYFMGQATPDPAREETIELILEPPEPETPEYVEVNPQAPENEPDRQENYSFRSQQAADERPEASPDATPGVEQGEDTSRKIVQGSVDPSAVTPLESGVYTLSETSAKGPVDSADAANYSNALPPTPLPPAPDFIQQQPEVDDGPGSRLKISGTEQQIAREYIDADTPLQLYRADAESQQNREDSRAENAAEAKPLPRKRLTLPPELVYGPLKRAKGSASRRGALAMDATFSQFGEYEQQFYAAVQAGWYQEIDFFQPIDTSAYVDVQFRIHADGTVDEVKILQSTASEIAKRICEMAITKRSPFRQWTPEMVKVFGQERVMKVRFLYR